MILACMAPPVAVNAQTTPLARGEELFLQDKMEEAAPFLETAISQYPRNEKLYLYLATAYEATGKTSLAVSTLQRGIEYGSEYLDVMYFNLGNNMFAADKHLVAVEMYSQAIRLNPGMSDAYLNRANSALELERFDDATDDYETYLTLNPGSSQREAIEQLLGVLKGILEEQRRIALEQERIRLEEEARKKALLDSVLNSLQNASESTTNLSAETEDVEQVDEEADIVE